MKNSPSPKNSIRKEPPAIAIAGGGAAGMIAAIVAARGGARVTLFERQERVGRKLLATGNGRCNLTNINSTAHNFQGKNPCFVTEALSQFSPTEAIRFFNELGLETRVEEEGKVFPTTGQASAVLDLLRFEMEKRKVTIACSTEITGISKNNGRFSLLGDSGKVEIDKVIIATGGMAAPHLGGGESGIALLAQLGHKSLTCFPALVPLKTDSKFSKHLKGLKIDSVIELFVNQKSIQIERGELLFTEYGLSGPPIIQISQNAMRSLGYNSHISLIIDMLPDNIRADLRNNLVSRVKRNPDGSLEQILTGLIHKRLIMLVIQDVRVDDPKIKVCELGMEDIDKIVDNIKNHSVDVTGSLGWRDAQVMAGGVDTRYFNPGTMESTLTRGIYAVGEVVDVTGDCGGFNLQWAWSSGFVAATHSILM